MFDRHPRFSIASMTRPMWWSVCSRNPGVHLHLPFEHGPELDRHVVPGRDLVRSDGEPGVGGNHPQLALALDRLGPERVPALGEPAAVARRPFRPDVVRGMGGTWREVDEERFVRHQRPLLPDPGDRAVAQVLGEVVLGICRHLERDRVLVQGRGVLVGLTGQEAVEVLEARTGGPAVERAQRTRLEGRHLMTLAELGRRVAVEPQDLGQRSRRVRSHRCVARCGGGEIGHRPHADRVVVATGQQGGPTG